MRFGLMAILGFVLVAGNHAQAARNDQSPARPQASAARSSASHATARPATHATARPAAHSSARSAATTTARAAARPGTTRTASATPASRAAAQPRHAVPYHNAAYASPQIRDRSGRLVSQPGYQRAVLRGPGARYAAACTTHRGRRVCGGTRQVAMRWSGGLAPAAGNQSSCPDGTMATLAVGHENVVRCVPL